MQSLSPSPLRLTGQVTVVLPVHIGEGFDYLVPEGMEVSLGSLVTVPFGKKEIIGVVWGAGTQNVSREKLRKIIVVHDAITPFSSSFIQFINYTANYYLAPRNQTIKLALNVPEAITHYPQQTKFFINQHRDLSNLSKKYADLYDKLFSLIQKKGDTAFSMEELIDIFPQPSSFFKKLIKEQYLLTQKTPLVPSLPSFCFSPPTLNPEQSEAAHTLKTICSDAPKYTCLLLEGVTGSGKTEVYFEAIETCLKQNKQILILLPEIALSHQWKHRFYQRFGFHPIIWNSGITPAKRRDLWYGLANGHYPVVVGARSTLYIPLPSLGLIIVDEEHDTSFKQEDHVMYHARDMAIVRAHTHNIPIILASATPSIETLGNVDNGKCTKLTLTSRFSQVSLPSITPIDMRQHKMPAGQWLSPPMREAINKTLLQNKQTLLFLNRRGYAPLMLCRHCGFRFACPTCTAWLVTHQSKDKMLCHHCGYNQPLPKECPECHEKNMLVPCGPGVERIFEETKNYYPEARIVMLNSDHTQSRETFETHIKEIISGNVDIIIGTQILAKGHHFPHLLTVGILDADLGLTGGDLRTIEHTWQLLHQISGRAGREKEKGRVFLQTWQPEHPLMKALVRGEGEKLIHLEKEARKNSHLPPYGRLAAIIIKSKNESDAIRTAQTLSKTRPIHPSITILGPAPAPLYRLREYYRIRFLIKTPRNINIQRIISDWIHNIKRPTHVKCKIDIDPYNFL